MDATSITATPVDATAGFIAATDGVNPVRCTVAASIDAPIFADTDAAGAAADTCTLAGDGDMPASAAAVGDHPVTATVASPITAPAVTAIEAACAVTDNTPSPGVAVTPPADDAPT